MIFLILLHIILERKNGQCHWWCNKHFYWRMYEADHVEIRLIVRKGNRIAEDFLVLFIAEGNPPLISLK